MNTTHVDAGSTATASIDNTFTALCDCEHAIDTVPVDNMS